ncbi:hypothetical protein Tco_1412104 [Tanacetum coccineum]
MGTQSSAVTKGKDGVYRVLPPTTQEEQFADEKERKARTLLFQKIISDVFMAWMMPKRFGQLSRQVGKDLGAGVSMKMQNHKFLRVPSSCMEQSSNALRTKKNFDTYSYNALQAKYDELQSEFGTQEAALVAHKLAVKKL